VHDAQRDTVDIDDVGRFEPADHHRHQVAAHHHRVGEPDHAAAVFGGLVRSQGSWRSRQAVVDVERDGEHRLELRLVPARKGAPAIGRLHLGGSDHLLDTVVVDVRAAVEAAELVVQDALEPIVRCSIRRRGASRGDEQSLGGRVEFPGGRSGIDLAARDREVDRVQHERLGRHRRRSARCGPFR
jgi:hypothetical protein